METQVIALKEKWIKFKDENPKTRIRNAAEALGVSELELLVTNCGEGTTRLQSNFEQILARIIQLGTVKAITRNDAVVHERNGEYKNGKFGPHASLFVGKDIDLRIFLSQWEHAFAVEEKTLESTRRSLQFFAKNGLALHKIYLTSKSNLSEFENLVNEQKSEDQSQSVVVVADQTPKQETVDDLIDVVGFRAAWKDLKDTHEFYGITHKFKVSRSQALRLAPKGNYAVKVQNNALRFIFEEVVEQNVPIMVFVSNKGIIQIHTGPIKKLVDYGSWFNVLDPEFNLHLKETSIDQSWIVRKPSKDGIISSLELYNNRKELIVTIFGQRKPGIPELETWASVLQKAQDQLSI